MKILFVALFLSLACAVHAQSTFTISGTVKNAKGEPVEAATIFMNGSKQITKADEKGAFVFNNVNPGTYQLVVNMIGYTSVKQNLVVQTASPTLNIVLSEKQITLSEVVIGDGSQRAQQVKTFIKNFLGESSNAKSCVITNTDLLEFTTRQTLLEATTPDFLLIENNNLGYRIK